MEGCPRSSMLSIDLKDSLPVEFTDSLKKVSIEDYFVVFWFILDTSFDVKNIFFVDNILYIDWFSSVSSTLLIITKKIPRIINMSVHSSNSLEW